jgi:hypothetical protein
MRILCGFLVQAQYKSCCLKFLEMMSMLLPRLLTMQQFVKKINYITRGALTTAIHLWLIPLACSDILQVTAQNVYMKFAKLPLFQLVHNY